MVLGTESAPVNAVVLGIELTPVNAFWVFGGRTDTKLLFRIHEPCFSTVSSAQVKVCLLFDSERLWVPSTDVADDPRRWQIDAAVPSHLKWENTLAANLAGGWNIVLPSHAIAGELIVAALSIRDTYGNLVAWHDLEPSQWPRLRTSGPAELNETSVCSIVDLGTINAACFYIRPLRATLDLHLFADAAGLKTIRSSRIIIEAAAASSLAFIIPNAECHAVMCLLFWLARLAS